MKISLSSHDEAASTEKLLEVIRRGQVDPSGKAPDFQAPPPRGKHKGPSASPRKIIRFKRKTVVGVDIGPTELRLVKVEQVSDHGARLLDFRACPLPSPGPGGVPDLHDVLKSQVADFAGAPQDFSLWTVLSTELADVRHLLIPKVPRRQSANAVFWTLKKEVGFDEKENNFDFEIQGEVTEKGITKTAVTAYIVPSRQVAEIKGLFSMSGLKLTGVTIAPFALQNLFRTQWVADADRTVGSLFIGDEHSRIDVFCRGSLALTRGIKTGLNSVVESLRDGFNERQRGKEAALDADAPGAPLALDGNGKMSERGAREIVQGLFVGPPSAGEASQSIGLAEGELLELIYPAMERLIRQTERTFDHYAATVGSESVSKIYVSSSNGLRRQIADYIGDQLGMSNAVMDPLASAAPSAGAGEAPSSGARRTGYAVALGASLSDNSRTPNLIFTFREKEDLAAVARIDRGIFMGFIAVICVLLGVFFWQGHTAGQKKAEISRLDAQLNGYSPRVDRNILTQLAGEAIKQQQRMRERSRDMLGVAAMGELSSLTPANIRLIQMTADLSGGPKEQTQKAAAGGTMVLDGVVLGDRQAMEASLAQYLTNLEASPILTAVSVQSSGFEIHEGQGEVLRFTLKLSLT